VRVDWAIPCRYAEKARDGTATLVGAGIDSIWAPSLPHRTALVLMLRFVGPEDEFEEGAPLEVRLVDPRFRETPVLASAVAAAPPPLKLPGAEMAASFTSSVGWNASDYGLYTLEVYLAGRRERSVALAIRPSSELEQLDE
jgi:hypothetical protein